jgi:PilZ domain
MPESNEIRRYPRYKGWKPVPVAWMYNTQKCVSKAENLSLGGLFIATPNPPPVGALIILLFHTPEGEVRVRSTVRNQIAGKGMGLAITSMEQEHRARLSRWLIALAKQAETATDPPAAS